MLITLNVSKMGTHITARVKGMSPKLASTTPLSVVTVSIFDTKVDIRIPIERVPASPMNILECLQKTLHRKKGMSAAIMTAERATILMS